MKWTAAAVVVLLGLRMPALGAPGNALQLHGVRVLDKSTLDTTRGRAANGLTCDYADCVVHAPGEENCNEYEPGVSCVRVWVYQVPRCLDLGHAGHICAPKVGYLHPCYVLEWGEFREDMCECTRAELYWAEAGCLGDGPGAG